MLRFSVLHPCESRTLQYACEELQAYLYRMAPAEDAGVELSLSVQAARAPQHAVSDPYLDDWYAIDATAARIEICGSNDRSVLLGVYRFLQELGCRFLMPGRAHEVVPVICLPAIRVHLAQAASFRHRGVCIEGADSVENVLDFIDWLPKVGCNSFFVQHLEPEAFLKNWYTHKYNPLLAPEAVTEAQYQAMYRRIDDAIALRGLLHHRVGHGWTCKAIGYEHVCTKVEGPTEAQRPLLALVNGRRDFWQGVPSNTNLCYAHPGARQAFVEAVVQYAARHPEVDYLHVWLADEYNNICECEPCRRTTPSDQYVALLNEIDDALTARGLPTRIAFLLYQELLWPPRKEKLRHPERFILMFAPISRTFEKSYADCRSVPASIPPYRRNQITLPATIEENLAFLRAWQEQCSVDAFVYDYPLGRAHYGDLGYTAISEIIARDIRQLPALGLNGCLSCQEFRVALPNTFPNYVMARLLWDRTLSFAQVRQEYFTALYGPAGDFAWTYLHTLSALTSADYFNGIGPRIDPELADRFALAGAWIEEARPRLQAGSAQCEGLQKFAWKLLDYYAGYGRLLVKALHALSSGEAAAAGRDWRAVMQYIRQHEQTYQPYFDVYRVLEVATKYTGFQLDVPR